MGDLPALIADHDVLSRCCKYGGVHNGAVWPPGPTGLRCAVVAYEEAAHAEACIAGWRVIRLLPRGNPSLPSITTTPTPEFRRRLQSLSGPGGFGIMRSGRQTHIPGLRAVGLSTSAKFAPEGLTNVSACTPKNCRPPMLPCHYTHTLQGAHTPTPRMSVN